MPKNITTIWGGTGTFNVLSGLKKNRDLNLAAVVSVADSGGSTGELRDEFGILPPGDIRRAVLALSEDADTVRKLFEYRFKSGNRMSGHTIGNLLLTALADISGSFEKGVEELCEMFHVRGKVIPVTLDDVHLWVVLEDGQRIIGETNIDVPKHDPNLAITDAFLIGWGMLNPRAKEAILNSDYVIVGPGDLYTSVVPNLLCTGMREALNATDAKIVYVCNIMTKHGETDGYDVEDFVETIEKYVGKKRIDYVLVNSGTIREELAQKYSKEEDKHPVKTRNIEELRKKWYRIVERDLGSETDFIRHDPKKLSKVIEDFVNGWIK